MGKIQEMVEDVLRDRGMVYDTQDNLVFKRHWRGQSVTMDMMAECHEELGILNINAVLPIIVPEDDAERVALEFAWLNSEMAFGNFSIEPKGRSVIFGASQLFDTDKEVDGQLVSNVVSAVKGGVINEEIIKDALFRSISEADNDFKEIVRTIFPKEEEE